MTEEQQKEREINELIMTEDNIEMTAHLENCPECQQGGVKGTLKIFSLIGCNISVTSLISFAFSASFGVLSIFSLSAVAL